MGECCRCRGDVFGWTGLVALFSEIAIEGECVQEGCAFGLRRDVWKMRSLRAQMQKGGNSKSRKIG